MSEYKIKDINKETVEAKDKEGEKKVEYIIEYKAKDSDKMKVENKAGEIEVDAKVKKKVGDEEAKDLGDKKVKIEYDKDSWFTHRGKITKVEGKDINQEKTKTVGFSGISTFTLGFWASMIALALLVGGGIWWWIASSKKEDKEEESL